MLTVSDTTVSPWCWDLCAGEQSQYPQQAVSSHYLAGTEGALSLPDLALWHYNGERHWHHELQCEQSRVHEIDVYVQQLRHFRAVAERQASRCAQPWRLGVLCKPHKRLCKRPKLANAKSVRPFQPERNP